MAGRQPDSVFDVIQGVIDEVGTTFSSATDIEKTIWFATSMEPMPPTSKDLRDIAMATRNPYVICKLH